MEKFEVDSHRMLDWINLLTTVHNQMVKKEEFSAGFNLCLLQQCMVDVLKDLERQEKRIKNGQKNGENYSRDENCGS